MAQLNDWVADALPSKPVDEVYKDRQAQRREAQLIEYEASLQPPATEAPKPEAKWRKPLEPSAQDPQGMQAGEKPLVDAQGQPLIEGADVPTGTPQESAVTIQPQQKQPGVARVQGDPQATGQAPNANQAAIQTTLQALEAMGTPAEYLFGQMSPDMKDRGQKVSLNELADKHIPGGIGNLVTKLEEMGLSPEMAAYMVALPVVTFGAIVDPANLIPFGGSGDKALKAVAKAVPHTLDSPSFYSGTERAVAGKTVPEKIDLNSLNGILKGAGVSAEEVRWLELDDLFKEQKTVTRDQILDHIQKNRVEISEVTQGTDPKATAKLNESMSAIDRQMQELNPLIEEERATSGLGESEAVINAKNEEILDSELDHLDDIEERIKLLETKRRELADGNGDLFPGTNNEAIDVLTDRIGELKDRLENEAGITEWDDLPEQERDSIRERLEERIREGVENDYADDFHNRWDSEDIEEGYKVWDHDVDNGVIHEEENGDYVIQSPRQLEGDTYSDLGTAQRQIFDHYHGSDADIREANDEALEQAFKDWQDGYGSIDSIRSVGTRHYHPDSDVVIYDRDGEISVEGGSRYMRRNNYRSVDDVQRDALSNHMEDNDSLWESISSAVDEAISRDEDSVVTDALNEYNGENRLTRRDEDGPAIGPVEGRQHRLMADREGLREQLRTQDKVKWGDYMVPGAEKKRNLLFRWANAPEGVDFRHMHWDGESNVIGHLRSSERVDTHGNTVDFGEEIQSDLNQQIHKEGNVASNPKEIKALEAEKEKVRDTVFSSDYGTPEYSTAEKRLEEINTKLRELKERAPDNPFRDTEEWSRIILKGWLRRAAEEGKDSIGWTQGRVHSKRWGTQEARWTKAEDGEGFILDYKAQVGGDAAGIDIEGDAIRQGLIEHQAAKRVTSLEETISKVEGTKSRDENDFEKRSIGSRLWAKMQKAESGMYQPRREGMEYFYDKILPSVARNYIKKWGGKVTTGTLPGAPEFKLVEENPGTNAPFTVREEGNAWISDFDTKEQAEAFIENSLSQFKFHQVHIPADMRDAIKNDPQSLFGQTFQGVEDFVKGLKPADQQLIVDALSKLETQPKWIKKLLKDEKGGVSQAAAWMLARFGIGFIAGSATGENPEQMVERGLIGAGLMALATPGNIRKLASLVRRTTPNAATDMDATQATAAGHTVVNIGTEKKPLPVDLDAIPSDSESVSAAIERAAQLSAQGGKRGHISNEETSRIADAIGMQPDHLTEFLSTPKGHAMNRERLLAGARLLYRSIKEHVPAKIEAFLASGSIPGGPEDLAFTEARRLKEEISKQFMGGREEAGGALQILRDPNAQSATKFEQGLQNEAELQGLKSPALPEGAQGPPAPDDLMSVSNAEYARIWQATNDKLGILERTERDAYEVTGWDMLSEMLYGNALSSVETHEKNLLSSALINPIDSFFIKAVASKLPVRGVATDGVAAGEASADAIGWYKGAAAALHTVKESYKEGGFVQLWQELHALQSRNAKTSEMGGKQGPKITGANLSNWMARKAGMEPHVPYAKPFLFDPNGPIALFTDWAGTGFRTPTQLLQAGDRFSHSVNVHMAKESLAWREAVKQGGDEATIAAKYNDLIQTMPKEIREASEKFAQHQIFQDVIDQYTHTGQMVKALGHPAMRPFMMFVKTPFLVMRFTAEHMPGLQLFVKSIQDDYKAGGARRQMAQAKALYGGTLTGLFFMGGASGRITGDGPSNPAVRKVWEIDHKPRSINFGTADKPHWISYEGLEPIASFASMAADASYAIYNEDHNVQNFIFGVMPMLGSALFVNKTWMKDGAELLDVMHNDGRDTAESKAKEIGKYLGNRVRSFVPGSSMLQAINKQIDPTMREVVGMWDSIKSRLPILSSTLPPLLNLKGEIVAYDDVGLDFLSPFAQKKTVKDPVADALWQNQVPEPAFPKVVGGQDVTAQEIHDLKEYRATVRPKAAGGLTMWERLDKEINSPHYNNPDLTSEGKRDLLSDIVLAYTQIAMGHEGQTNPKFAKNRIAIEAAHKKGNRLDIPAEAFKLNP